MVGLRWYEWFGVVDLGIEGDSEFAVLGVEWVEVAVIGWEVP